MITLAQTEHPQIIIAQYEQYAAEHNIDSVFGELLPQVSAYASINKQYDPQPGIVEDSQTETIGLRATLALYEGGATRSRIREAKKEAHRLKYLIEETKRRLKQQVTSRWREYQTAQTVTKNRHAEIAAAQNALSGVREESRLGQRTVLDVLDADEDLIEARTALARAKRNEAEAKFALAHAMGILTKHPSLVFKDILLAENEDIEENTKEKAEER